jgi:hypothetical protein
MKRSVVEVNLIPGKRDDFARTQSVAEHHFDEERIPQAIAASSGSSDADRPHLVDGQVLTAPTVLVPLTLRRQITRLCRFLRLDKVQRHAISSRRVASTIAQLCRKSEFSAQLRRC